MKQKELTRAQAERLVARTTDEATLMELAKHKNPHVARKVRFKLLSLEDRRNATGIKYFSVFVQSVDASFVAARVAEAEAAARAEEAQVAS